MKDETLRIERVGVRVLDIPMRKAFGIAGGTQEVAKNVLVSVELGGGVTGYGEAAPLPAFNGETQEDAVAKLLALTARVHGRSVGALRPLCEEVRHHARSADLGTPSASASCALETAILDAFTRAHGMSLRHFFGGAETTLRTDVTITTGTEQEAAREARAFAAFDTLKIKVGGSSVDHDVVRVLAVHQARPDARLLLDANGGLDVDEAVALAEGVLRHGAVIRLFEQPVAAGNFEALAEVRARTGLTIAIDESVTRVDDVVQAHRRAAADAVNIKLMKSGPLVALDIARTALALGLQPMIGGMVEARLAMGTSACLAAGLGGFAFVDLDTPLFLAADPFEGGYRYVDGGPTLDLGPIELGHGAVPRA